MSKISIIGIDLAKSVFQLHGIDSLGHKRLGKQVKREALLKTIAQLPSCTIAMEACCGAYYWGEQFEALGHTVKIIPPQYVKPFVQVNKNDARDAQAIAESAARPATPTIAVKSVEQQDLQAIHRVRERLVKEKTAISNELRGLLAEVGIVLPKGHKSLLERVPAILEDAENNLSVRRRMLIDDLRDQWLERSQRIEGYDLELQLIAKQNERCKLLQTIPGIGPVIATLMYSYIGSASNYKSGRHLSAALGLVPRQHGSGGKERLLGISKQGNKQVRKQLVHGARAAYRVLSRPENTSRLGGWVQRKLDKHPNKVIVGLANKLARIIWAIMMRNEPYKA